MLDLEEAEMTAARYFRKYKKSMCLTLSSEHSLPWDIFACSCHCLFINLPGGVVSRSVKDSGESPGGEKEGGKQ